MSKILFWIVVVFALLLVVRLINVAKAKERRKAPPPEPRKAIPTSEPSVRCASCGVFLPKSDAVAVPTGYRCQDPACARGR